MIPSMPEDPADPEPGRPAEEPGSNPEPLEAPGTGDAEPRIDPAEPDDARRDDAG